MTSREILSGPRTYGMFSLPFAEKYEEGAGQLFVVRQPSGREMFVNMFTDKKDLLKKIDEYLFKDGILANYEKVTKVDDKTYTVKLGNKKSSFIIKYY